MTQAEATARVALGAALLDAKRPGWALKIQTRRLAMASCDRCVLGQLFGPHLAEFDSAVHSGFGAGLLYLNVEFPAVYGFAINAADGDTIGPRNWRMLKLAWMHAIDARVAAAAQACAIAVATDAEVVRV